MKRRIQSGVSLKEEVTEREIKPHLNFPTKAEFINSPVYKDTEKEYTPDNTSKKTNQTVKEQILGLIMK